MKEIIEEIRSNYPDWIRKKQRQAPTPKDQRQRNGRRPNCRLVELKPEYIPLQLPEA